VEVGSRWRWVVICTPQPLHLFPPFRVKTLGVRSRLGGTQSCTRRYGEEKGLFVMLGYEPHTSPSHSLVHSAYQLKCPDLSFRQLHDVLDGVQTKNVFFYMFAYVRFRSWHLIMEYTKLCVISAAFLSLYY
jgi:hypothetical protein